VALPSKILVIPLGTYMLLSISITQTAKKASEPSVTKNDKLDDSEY